MEAKNHLRYIGLSIFVCKIILICIYFNFYEDYQEVIKYEI